LRHILPLLRLAGIVILGAGLAITLGSNAGAQPASSPDARPAVADCEAEAVQKLAAPMLANPITKDTDWVEFFREELKAGKDDALYAVGNCYYSRRQWTQAREAYLTAVRHSDRTMSTTLGNSFWRLALTEERLGQSPQAIVHIKLAGNTGLVIGFDETLCSQRMKSDAAFVGKEARAFCNDYLRINAREVAHARSADQTDSRAYWEQSSTDQRAVMRANGGTRDANIDARPCHVEEFTGAHYAQITWWYCDGSTYSMGYTFLNGHLTTTYKP
jgi:hypothetical protein